MLRENLGNKFDTISIFKPNAPLAKVADDLRKVGIGITKQDHVIIVGGQLRALIEIIIRQYKRVSTLLQSEKKVCFL
jgi:hypothetical protein